MSQAVGQLRYTRGDVLVEWTIENFLSLPAVKNSFRKSSLFCFAGASFFLKIFPNGERRHNNGGKICLYLIRYDSGSPVKLQFTLGLMTTGGKRTNTLDLEFNFKKKYLGYGAKGMITRSQLLDRKAELVPSDALTVFSSITCDTSYCLQGSVINRLADVSASLKNILTQKKRTNVVLEVKGRQFPAHRLILESRSPVFSAMFKNRARRVVIKDIQPTAFQIFLTYVYCGEVEGLSPDNVYEVYAAADRHNFKDLKLMCREFLERNLSAARVCDVIKFAQLYGETKTEQIAKEYFKNNMKTVLETDRWKTLAKEDSQFCLTLLTSAIKEIL